MAKKEKTDIKEKKSSIYWDIIKIVFQALYPRELIRLNKGAIKANEIFKNSYFKRQVRLNRFFILLSFFPILMSFYLIKVSLDLFSELGLYFVSVWEKILNQIKLRSFNLDSIPMPDENTLALLGYTGLTVLILIVSSIALSLLISKLNPLIKETLVLEKLLIETGFSKRERIDYLLCSPAGVLLRCDGDIVDLVKNKEIWAKIHKIPADPIPDKYDDTIYFVKNGFKLASSYTYKF